MVSRQLLAATTLAVVLCAGCGTPSASSSTGSDSTGGTVTSGGNTSFTSGTSSTGTTTSGTTAGTTTAATGTTTGGTTTGVTTGTTTGATTGATTGTVGGAVSFDGTRAFTLLQAQCNFGPRPMGTDAHTRCLNWIVEQLTPLVDSRPVLQTFSYKSPTSGQTFDVTNVIGRINPTARTQVMIAGHWDTRPFADQDTTPANRTKPILGASDGASEIAAMLELARVFHANRPTAGVEFVFFDGEDYTPAPGNYNEMYLGSKYFADHLTDATTNVSFRPTYGILLDLIGDQQLDIYEEVNSVNRAPTIVQKVWGAAAALGYGTSFIPQTKYTIDDDHLPLLDKGIPVIDCIDFDYETFQDPARQYWHTLMDTPEHCSAQSLQIVGNVMSKVVYGES